jgi:hypothetical protein
LCLSWRMLYVTTLIKPTYQIPKSIQRIMKTIKDVRFAPQMILRKVISYLGCCVDWLDAWHGFNCGTVSSLGEKSWRHRHCRLDMSICWQKSVFQFSSNYAHRRTLQLLLQPTKCTMEMCNFIIKALHLQHV